VKSSDRGLHQVRDSFDAGLARTQSIIIRVEELVKKLKMGARWLSCRWEGVLRRVTR
jgi:hypothetical protein